MSYVLEALRRSEEQRRRGAPPDIFSLPSPAATRVPRRRLWYPALAAALLINALIFAAWLQPWGTDEAPNADPAAVSPPARATVDPAAAASEPRTPQQLTTVEEGARPVPRGQGPKRTKPSAVLAGTSDPLPKETDALPPPPAGTAGPEVASHSEPSTPISLIAKIRPPRKPDLPAATPIPADAARPVLDVKPRPPVARITRSQESEPGSAAEGVKEEAAIATAAFESEPRPIEPVAALNVQSVKDLAPEEQGKLPEIAFSIHSYSAEPRARMVRINGRTMREGSTLAPDLVVAEITRDGVIFSLRGSRFFMSRTDSWGTGQGAFRQR